MYVHYNEFKFIYVKICVHKEIQLKSKQVCTLFTKVKIKKIALHTNKHIEQT